VLFEITIPVLNEEKTLRKNVEKVYDFLEESIIDNYTILIADNGSIDKTPLIGDKLSDEYDDVKYIKVGKRGVGLALRTSWMKSEAEIVGYMDLDLATNLKHLIDVYNEFIENDKIDIVNGSRLLPNSVVVNRTLLREITSRGFNFLIQNLLNVNISDGMCGFKFFRRDKAQSLIKTGINIDGWFFSTEILVKADWSKMTIKEIPIEWTDDQDSKVNVVKLSSNYFKQILRLKFEKNRFLDDSKKED